MNETQEVTPEQRGLASSDGRNVDPALGTLEGEGALQRVKHLEQPNPTEHAFREVPSRQAAPDEIPTYYGQPMLKAPVWKAAIAAYLYVGGAAGSASALGAAVMILDGAHYPKVRRLCRWIGTLGDVASAGLLIYDLGRPTRFFNMLRVFRPTSPMSVGTYILALSGAGNSASVLLAERRGVLGWLGRAADSFAGALGLPLSGYTGVLLSNTAVPVWQGARRSLPVLFVGSAMTSATSILDFFELSPIEARLVRRMGVLGKGVELAAAAALEREVGQVEQAARPLKHGVSGALWRASAVLTAASLVTALLPGMQRWKRALAGALGTAGAVALRLAVFQAGKASAKDPRASFAQQRAGLGAAEVTGIPAIAGPEGRPAVFKLPVLR